MSFILDYLTSTRPADKADDVQAEHLYRTTDAQATVLAENYFLDGYTLVPLNDNTLTVSSVAQRAVDRFYVGDTIKIQTVDSSGNPVDEYSVLVSYLDKSSDPLFVVELLNPGEVVAIGTLTDVSTASNVTVTFSQTVELDSATFYLGGPITVADAAVKVSIGAVDIPNATATILYASSAKGDRYNVTAFEGLNVGSAFKITSDGASTTAASLKIVLRGKVATGNIAYITCSIPNVSEATAGYCAAPFPGTVLKIEAVLQAAITGSSNTLTSAIGGVSITNGALTQAAAAAGTRVVVYPTAANAVLEGDILSCTSNGGSTDAAIADITFYIKRS